MRGDAAPTAVSSEGETEGSKAPVPEPGATTLRMLHVRPLSVLTMTLVGPVEMGQWLIGMYTVPSPDTRILPNSGPQLSKGSGGGSGENVMPPSWLTQQ